MFPATPRQRCVVPKAGKVVSAVSKRVRGAIGAEIANIWQQPDKENGRLVLEAFKLR